MPISLLRSIQHHLEDQTLLQSTALVENQWGGVLRRTLSSPHSQASTAIPADFFSTFDGLFHFWNARGDCNISVHKSSGISSSNDSSSHTDTSRRFTVQAVKVLTIPSTEAVRPNHNCSAVVNLPKSHSKACTYFGRAIYHLKRMVSRRGARISSYQLSERCDGQIAH
jgi:hypothetical protein